MASELSPEQIKAAFDKFDADGSGTVSKAEVKDIILEMGLEEADAESIAQRIMNKADEDGNDRLSFEEFRTGVMEG